MSNDLGGTHALPRPLRSKDRASRVPENEAFPKWLKIKRFTHALLIGRAEAVRSGATLLSHQCVASYAIYRFPQVPATRVPSGFLDTNSPPVQKTP